MFSGIRRREVNIDKDDFMGTFVKNNIVCPAWYDVKVFVAVKSCKERLPDANENSTRTVMPTGR